MDSSQIILGTLTTEKTTNISSQNKYTFVVSSKATKVDIKRAINDMYEVEAQDVNIINTPAKKRLVRRGKEITKRKEVKKALVTLKKGKTLDLSKVKEKKEK